MKTSLLFAILVLLSIVYAEAQVGIGTESPNPKSVLELKSPGNNQGFLVPRLTTAQRIAISGLSENDKGLLIFDSTVNKFYYWSGSVWVIIDDSVGSGTVTSINTGGGLTGGPISVSGTISIADNGVTTAKIVDGAVTSAKITDGTIATADIANGAVTGVKLSNTGVTAASYGNATTVPQFTVDAQGRITAASGVTIAGVAPGGAAGGDLTGTYPNPTIANNAITSAKIVDGTIATGDIANGAITDVKISNVAPGKLTQAGATAGQVLKWNGTAWVPQADDTGTGSLPSLSSGQLITNNGTSNIAVSMSGDATFTSSGALTVSNNAITSAKIADGSISNTDISNTAAISVNKLAAGANGQVLTTTAGVPTWSTASSGTVTNIVTGSGLSGGPITTSGTISLANTSVTPGSYGSATQVANFTVDAQGRLTTAGNTTISGVAPGGAAGGDLTGSYPSPTIANNAITSAKIQDGTVANADISNAAAIAVNKLAAGTNGQVLTTTAGVPTWSAPSSGTVTNILTGTGLTGGPITTTGTVSIAANGVTSTELRSDAVTDANRAVTTNHIRDNAITTAKINNGAVTAAKLANTSVTTGSYGSATQVATFTVDAQGRLTAAGNTTIAGVTPGGAAGGDLSGTFPNPSVAQIQSRPVANTAPTANQVLKWNGTQWAPGVDDAGGLTLPYVATSGVASTLFDITQDSGNGGNARFRITNAGNNGVALTASTTGTGFPLVVNGVNFGAGASSTAQGGVAGYFVNNADRGYGVLGALQTTTTPSQGALGYSFIQDATVFGVGVYGNGKHYGVRATGGTQGGYFENSSGLFTTILAGNGAAVWARSDENSGVGIRGIGGGTTSTGVYGNGSSYGVYGIGDADGVYGYTFSTGATGYAIYGIHPSTLGTAAAIRGETNSTAAFATAITGVVNSTSPGGSSTALRGINNGTGGLGIGVWGSHAGSGWGVYGQALGTGRAIYGNNNDATGYAGYFLGRVAVTGALSKGSGTFKIDHPLDPANKYLYHSFVESPDMKNIYDGVVTLDAQGEAEVTLPDWFGALNKDFRYQLTCIGGYAPVYVAQEVVNNRFSIAGGKPGMKVSWQLTGIRKDPYAEKNRVKVEEDKTGDERGKYLYPEAYNLPANMGIGFEQQQAQQATLNNEVIRQMESPEQVKRKSEEANKLPAPRQKETTEAIKLPKIN